MLYKMKKEIPSKLGKPFSSIGKHSHAGAVSERERTTEILSLTLPRWRDELVRSVGMDLICRYVNVHGNTLFLPFSQNVFCNNILGIR